MGATKGRAVALVPQQQTAAAVGSSPPTTIEGIEERLNLTGNELMRLPHIGPLVASERPVVASWPGNAPTRIVSTTINPVGAAPRPSPYTTPSAQLPVQLVAMMQERKRMLERMNDPDMETLVAMHFSVVEECCKRLNRHFPSYREVYRGMQDSVTALHDNFGKMLADIDTLSGAVNAGQKRSKQLSENAKAVQQSAESELVALRSQCLDNTTALEQIRVLSTQNTDLFEQLKKMKRKVLESDEISQHVSSRNIVLTVNQGRLEHEVDRLNRLVEAIREHHDSDRKLLDHRANAIQAMETKIESLDARLDVTESNLRKSHFDNRAVIEANRSLTEMNSRLQQQLQQALDASMRSISAASSPTSRAVSPRGISSRSKRLGDGEPTTPRPDWAMTSMLLQHHEDQLVSQLKGLPTSRDKLRLLSQAFVAAKQRLRAAEADVVVVAQRAAVSALVAQQQQQPLSLTTPGQQPLSTPSTTSRRSSVKLHMAPVFRRKVLEVFSTASHFISTSDDVSDNHSRGGVFLHEYLNIPLTEVPRLDIASHEVAAICTKLFHQGLLGKLVALTDRYSSALSPSTRSDGNTPIFEATPHLNTVGSELANVLMGRDESNSDLTSQRAAAPFNRTSFYSVMLSVAEDFIVEPLFKNCGLDALPLPPGVTQVEVAVRSLIRACQEQESSDAYSRLLLHCLADTVAPTTFLYFRKEIEKLRSYMISAKDQYVTGRCDPLTFTMAVKKVWPYCGDLQLDVIQRLAKEELQLTAGIHGAPSAASAFAHTTSAPVPPAGLVERNSSFFSATSGPLDTVMDVIPSSAAAAAREFAKFRAPPLVVQPEKVLWFHYLDALNTTTTTIHQYLLHVFISNVVSSQAAVVELLRGLAERNARPSEASALAANGGQLTSPVGASSGPVSTTIGTLLASIQKMDSKKDKESVREYVAALIGKESLGDTAMTVRCELLSVMDSARQVFYIRSSPSEATSTNGNSGGPSGGRSPAPLPLVETRELEEGGIIIPPTPPSAPALPLVKQQSMRRKSSVSIKK